MAFSSSPAATGNTYIHTAIRARNPLHVAIVFVATFIAVYSVETGGIALIGGGR